MPAQNSRWRRCTGRVDLSALKRFLSRDTGLCVEAGGQIEQRTLGKGGGDQRNPEGEPVFAKTRRDRNRRQIEQVHEIRIQTEIGIEAERVRVNRSFLVDRAASRQKQHVNRPEYDIGLTLQHEAEIDSYEARHPVPAAWYE